MENNKKIIHLIPEEQRVHKKKHSTVIVKGIGLGCLVMFIIVVLLAALVCVGMLADLPWVDVEKLWKGEWIFPD